MKEVPDEDLILAYRYLYYVHGISAVPDHAYDAMEKAAREAADLDSILHLPGSDLPDSYPDRIRALATYIICLLREKRHA